MDNQVSEIIDRLVREFPAAFVSDQERRRPLKIGIHADVVQHFGSTIDPKLVRLALRTYVGDAGYLRALQSGAKRVNLVGEPSGTVTAKQAASAVVALSRSNAARMRDGLSSLREAARRRR